jgi:hypothetical protein
MSKQTIHIDNLRIRLPRGAAASARSIARGLGGEILRSLAEAAHGQTGAERIEKISVGGKIQAASGAAPEKLQKEIARRVAAELKKRA